MKKIIIAVSVLALAGCGNKPKVLGPVEKKNSENKTAPQIPEPGKTDRTQIDNGGGTVAHDPVPVETPTPEVEPTSTPEPVAATPTPEPVVATPTPTVPQVTPTPEPQVESGVHELNLMAFYKISFQIVQPELFVKSIDAPVMFSDGTTIEEAAFDTTFNASKPICTGFAQEGAETSAKEFFGKGGLIRLKNYRENTTSKDGVDTTSAVFVIENDFGILCLRKGNTPILDAEIREALKGIATLQIRP